jgi:hypothetical protein
MLMEEFKYPCSFRVTNSDNPDLFKGNDATLEVREPEVGRMLHIISFLTAAAHDYGRKQGNRRASD